MFITKDPKNTTYYELLDIAFDVCDEFILVERNDGGLLLNQKGRTILEKLKGSLKEVKKQSKWVSGELWDKTALIYYYNTDQNAKKILKELSTSLHSWVHPNFPEDLCFIKEGSPWLINTAHERESYIETVDVNEIEKIKAIDGLLVRF